MCVRFGCVDIGHTEEDVGVLELSVELSPYEPNPEPIGLYEVQPNPSVRIHLCTCICEVKTRIAERQA